MSKIQEYGIVCITFIDKFPYQVPILGDASNILIEAIKMIASAAFNCLKYICHKINENEKAARKSRIRKNLFINMPQRMQQFEEKYDNLKTKWKTQDLERVKECLTIDEKSNLCRLEQIRRDCWLRKSFTKTEWKIMHPHIDEEPHVKALRKQESIKEDPYGLRDKSVIFEKDELFHFRIAFKVCCIFLCIYVIPVV